MVAQPIVLFLQYIISVSDPTNMCYEFVVWNLQMNFAITSKWYIKYGTWCKTTRATYLQNVLSELGYAKIYRFFAGKLDKN